MVLSRYRLYCFWCPLVILFLLAHFATFFEISHAGAGPQFPYILAPILVIPSYVPPCIDGNPRPVQSLCDNCCTLIAIWVCDSINVTRPVHMSIFNLVNCSGCYVFSFIHVRADVSLGRQCKYRGHFKKWFYISCALTIDHTTVPGESLLYLCMLHCWCQTRTNME